MGVGGLFKGIARVASTRCNLLSSIPLAIIRPSIPVEETAEIVARRTHFDVELFWPPPSRHGQAANCHCGSVASFYQTWPCGQAHLLNELSTAFLMNFD